MQNKLQNEQLIRKSFALFELPVHASIHTIKRRYKQLAKKLHPDVNINESATELFNELKEAFEVLISYKTSDFRLTEEGKGLTNKSEKDLIKEKYRKSIKQQLIDYYRYQNDSIADSKRSAAQVFMINLNFVFVVMIVLVLPPLLTFSFGLDGVLLAIVINVFLSLFTASAVRNLNRTDIVLLLQRILKK
jgi:hypothetical protein